MKKSKDTLNRDSSRGRVGKIKSISTELEIVPLAKGHLKEAAALVAARYREERALNPLFPERYESPAAVLPLLSYNAEKQVGVAAVRGGKIIGFMTSLPFTSRGVPAVWIPDWGHGAEQSDREYLYRWMYAIMAQQWVTKGHLKHAVMTFADEREVLDTWFSIGFGMENIDALRDISPVSRPIADIEIRKAGPEDFEVLMKYRRSIAAHIAATPVFQFNPAEAVEAGAADFRRQLLDANTAIWLACEKGKIIGCMRVIPSHQFDFKMPTIDKAICGITMAFTGETVRQQGVATALLERVLQWAREKGYDRCAVDFESANIPGSRFWLSHFRPVCYTLVRYIDGRFLQRKPGGKNRVPNNI